jgi:hypothetical protein
MRGHLHNKIVCVQTIHDLGTVWDGVVFFVKVISMISGIADSNQNNCKNENVPTVWGCTDIYKQ